MFLTLKITVFVCTVVAVAHGFAVKQPTKLRFCVESKALEKCQALSNVMRIENAGIDLECVSDKNCVKVVANDASADAVIVNADDHPGALKQLDAVLFESYDKDNLIVALIDADKESKVHDLPLFYENRDDLRLLHAALYINHHRNDGKCARTVRTGEGGAIHLERYHEIKDVKNKKLVCIQNDQLVVKPISEYKNCHVESNIPNAVMIKKGASNKNEIVEAFLTAANKFGHGSKFELFGPFNGKHDLIFSDETKALVPVHSEPNGISVEKFLSLHCDNIDNHDHAHDHAHDHDHDHDHDHHHHH